MAGVKSRLQLFEQNTDSTSMNSFRPNVAAKPGYGKNLPPALQKFQQKQNEASDGMDGTSPAGKPAVPAPAKKPVAVGGGPKFGAGVAINRAGEQDENKTGPGHIPGKPSQIRQKTTSVTPASSENRRVSVPHAFLKDAANTNNTPKPPVTAPKTLPKDTGARPPTALKPPVVGGKPSPVSPSLPENKTSAITDKPKPSTTPFVNSSIGVRLPAMDKKPASKTESTTSSTSSSSVSSSSQPPSSPPAADKGVFDFRSQLRSVKKSPGAVPVGRNNIAPVKALVPPPGAVNNNKPDKDKEPVTNGTTAPNLPTKPSSPPAMQDDSNSVQMRNVNGKDSNQELKRHSSGLIVERKSDSKKFKKVRLDKNPTPPTAPAKPTLPSDVDLTQIREQYQKTILNLKNESDASNAQIEEADEIYADAYSAEEEVLPRRSTFKRKSERISFIPDMSAEEEGVDGPLYDEGFTPASPAPVPIADDAYVGAETERKPDGEEHDEDAIYEDEAAFALPQEETEEEKRKRLKEEAEQKKREEKERREEEKRRKKEEKERANKEKEEMKLRKKFNAKSGKIGIPLLAMTTPVGGVSGLRYTPKKLTGTETKVGEGVIKQDVKGWGLGLSLKKGQMVTIVRLDNNPPNKWLIKTDSTMGYVDSNIIEVDPGIIKQAMAMASGRKNSSVGGDDQPSYDDVPNEIEIEDDEEIYEECP